MRKSFLFALAAVGMLASCSSDDSFSPNQEQNDNDLQEIRLGMSSTAVSTRGTGTVGGVEDEDEENSSSNLWQGQLVNVFMLNQGTLDIAMFASGDSETPIYDNAVFKTPEGKNSDYASFAGNEKKYYPATGNFDFWGYRLDDAENGDYTVNADGTITVPFHLTGSQDVMVAKAVPTTDDITKLTASSENDATRYFSAFSARRGVQPNLTFNHVLSRLTFTVKAGADKKESALAACGYPAGATSEADRVDGDGVFVDSIKVYSKTTGKLVVAYTPEVAANYPTPASQVVFDEITQGMEAVSLMQRAAGATEADNLETLTPVRPEWDFAKDKAKDDDVVGEALLLAPMNNYEMVVYMSQKIEDVPEPVVSTLPATVKLSGEGGAFQAGMTYNVNISIYSLEKIEVKTTLTGWEPGGDTVPVNPDLND